ncbi:S1 family peptidase [Pseudonocardia sp. NPDC046786]|uniref:S1 family peptidase n=1 Tax=Pseudonocardia sp. NPDC046786 TaxID=3155471 RepID=UPI0033FAE262
MPLRRPHRLSLAALAGAAVIALGVAVPAAAAPVPPVGPSALTETAAAELVPAVTAAAGDALAGTWFEDGRLMVGIWDPAPAAVLGALGATPVLREGPRRDPSAALRALGDRTAAGLPDGLASYGIDPRTAHLVLDVVEGPDAGRLAGELTAGLDPAVVRVERVPAVPRRQAAVSGGDTISDGSRRCTAGFAASDSAGDWVITAGHCLRGSATWYAADQSTIGSGGRTAGDGVDVGAIPVEQGSASATVAGTRVRGTSVAPVGSSVCLHGSTSGRSCGTVQRTDVTVNFEGEQQSGLTAVGACAREGDSGAPYITSGGQAQGVHTGAGGSGNCTSYFTPVRTATSALNLTLTTG